MVRFLGLLTAAVVSASLLAIPTAAIADDPTCPPSAIQLGTCGVSDGTGVVVTGTHSGQQPGSGGSGGGSSAGKPLTPAQIQALLNEICTGDGVCGSTRAAFLLNPLLPPGTPGAPAAGTAPQVVTAADVARFLPAIGALRSEPDGWAVVGVPANFWAQVSAVTVDGTLLGGPAEVRFTPQLYRWDYGDGSSRTTAGPGSSWAALGQDELTTTPTSHRYTERATRQAQVEVVYSAEYRVGTGPWLPVVGAVVGATPPHPMLVVTERTVLTPPA